MTHDSQRARGPPKFRRTIDLTSALQLLKGHRASWALQLLQPELQMPADLRRIPTSPRPFDQRARGAAIARRGDAALAAARSRRVRGRGQPETARQLARAYGATTWRDAFVDIVQLLLKYLKDVRFAATLDQREYGAFIASSHFGKFDSMTYGPQTPFVDPDNYVYGVYYPDELKNQSHVNDPVVTDLLIRQRRTTDPARRRRTRFPGTPRHA